MPAIEEFLNPKSMLTPGLAGGATMLITATLSSQFSLPGKWTALVLSFLLGTLSFAAATTPIWQRCVLYLFNSLIIFAMSVGLNATGVAATPVRKTVIAHFDEGRPVDPGPAVQDKTAFFHDWFHP